MAKVSRQEAWIEETKNQRPDVGLLIPCPAGEPMTYLLCRRETEAVRTGSLTCSTQSESILKYLVIGALFAIVFVLIYSRIRPYLELLRKISRLMREMLNASSPSDSVSGTSRSEHKLVRCASCGTWVPANRAIGERAMSSVYCSRECLQKESA